MRGPRFFSSIINDEIGHMIIASRTLRLATASDIRDVRIDLFQPEPNSRTH